MLEGIALATVSIVLTGCPPALYLSIANETHHAVKVDCLDRTGSGTFLPHFQLSPGESRRVVAGYYVVAHDISGHQIGKLDPSQLKTPSDYFSYRTYTFTVAIRESGIIPVRPHEKT